VVELPFCVVGGPKGHKHIIWVGGPQGLKHTTWTRKNSSCNNYGKIYYSIMQVKKKKKKNDNSKKNDMFLNCRSCNTIITNDYRSKFDKRYCADCL
jgi:hypothetical protein